MGWIPTVDVRSTSRGEQRRPGQAVVALLMIVTFLPAIARWLWLVAVVLVGALVVAVFSWRGTRRRISRWRERRALRRDGRAHRVRGTVRIAESDVLRVENGVARARPFALESDDGRLVLVDPSLGYVSSRLRELRVGDRVVVLAPSAEMPVELPLPDLRFYRGAAAPLSLGGRLHAPIFLEPG